MVRNSDLKKHCSVFWHYNIRFVPARENFPAIIVHVFAEHLQFFLDGSSCFTNQYPALSFKIIFREELPTKSVTARHFLLFSCSKPLPGCRKTVRLSGGAKVRVLYEPFLRITFRRIRIGDIRIPDIKTFRILKNPEVLHGLNEYDLYHSSLKHCKVFNASLTPGPHAPG